MTEPPTEWRDLSPADAWTLTLWAALALAFVPFAWAEVRWTQWCGKHLKARRR